MARFLSPNPLPGYTTDMMSAAPADARTRVLVTGFGAFPGARSNPTLDILARLGRSRRPALFGVEIVTRALPVLHSGAEARIASMIRDTRPHAILQLGLAARRKTLTVETRALNRLYSLRLDAARKTPASTQVTPGADAMRASRWPDARILRALRGAGAPARRSIDAGDYSCNQTLFLTLGSTRAPAGFIHVPRPRGRRRPGADPRPSLATMTRAIEAAALELARYARASKDTR